MRVWALCVFLFAGCTSVEGVQDDRALASVVGKWRAVAVYSAELRGWQGTYEFRPPRGSLDGGEVEIHGSWKDAVSGEAGHEDLVRSFETRAGHVKIAGEKALIAARPDGKLEVVRLAYADTRGAHAEEKLVLERMGPLERK